MDWDAGFILLLTVDIINYRIVFINRFRLNISFCYAYVYS